MYDNLGDSFFIFSILEDKHTLRDYSSGCYHQAFATETSCTRLTVLVLNRSSLCVSNTDRRQW